MGTETATLTETQWREAAVRFAFAWDHPNGVISEVVISQRGRSPLAWAVEHEGEVLGKDAEWAYEPPPSARSPAFLAVYRWESAPEAYAFAQKHLVGHLRDAWLR